MPIIYKGFYKSPTGPNDSKLVALLRKLSRLDEYFEGMTESNILTRV